MFYYSVTNHFYCSLFLSASAYNVLVAASALLGFGSAGLSVLSVTYIDENVPKKMMPLYIGNEQLNFEKKDFNL